MEGSNKPEASLSGTVDLDTAQDAIAWSHR